MNPAIHTEQLARKFGRTRAVDAVDIDVPAGAIYALVGPNGAGKTTMIKLLMNILRPSSGRAQVLGIDTQHLAGRAFQKVGYVSKTWRCRNG